MSLKKSIFYTTLTQVPTLLLYFAASMLMTRLLGDEGRGEYALITNQSALFSMLLSLNIGYGISYFAAKEGQSRNVVGTAATLLLINLLLAPLLLAGVRAVPAANELLMPQRAGHWLYWAFIYASIMLSLINTACLSMLLSRKRFRELNLASIAGAGVSAAGFAVLFILRDRIDPERMLAAVLIVTIASQGVITGLSGLLYAIHIGLRPAPVWAWSAIRPVLAFSMVGYLSILVNMVNYRFDTWVVNHYHGTASLGVYAVGVGLAQLLFHVPEPFSRVVQPYLFGSHDAGMLARFKAVSRINFTLVLGLAAVLALIAPWAVTLIFGEVFAASVLPLRLLLPGIVLNCAFKLLAQLVVQGGLQRYNLFAAAVGAAFTIGLDFALIPAMGIAGAAIASTLAYAAVLAVVLHAIRHRMGIAVGDLFFVRASDIRALLGGRLGTGHG
ncbi:MAG: polysaccharide biosynthesis C-terminal domain-containing protein [Flavobacteriales bacterium]|nr:polysaccharide biosynthesis C-terminal domain-containing protein [Flavobacteriales bacterium]